MVVAGNCHPSLLPVYQESADHTMLSVISRYCIVGTLSDYFKARVSVLISFLIQFCGLLQRAMYAHLSQYVWFRRLYITFSRYMIINTLQELKQ